MQKIIKLLALAIIISLLGFPTKVVSETVEIKEDIKVYAFKVILEKWGSEQWDSFDKLVNKESKWLVTAQNPTTSAYGIGQFLNSTWSIVGCEKTSDEYKQVDCMIDYIEYRYEKPSKALQFHLKNNYY